MGYSLSYGPHVPISRVFVLGLKHQMGFHKVRPDNNWFPGIDKLKEDFLSEKWIFGKTPKFKVSKSFKVPEEIMETPELAEMCLEIEVVNGIVENVMIQMATGNLDSDFSNLAQHLISMTFDCELIKNFCAKIKMEKVIVPLDKERWFVHCLCETIGKFI